MRPEVGVWGDETEALGLGSATIIVDRRGHYPN